MSLQNNLTICSDKWPYINDENKLVRIDNGWLLNGETEVQFHFYDKPLQMWTDDEHETTATTKKTPYSIIIKPFRKNGTSGLIELTDFVYNRSVRKIIFYAFTTELYKI